MKPRILLEKLRDYDPGPHDATIAVITYLVTCAAIGLVFARMSGAL